MQEAMLRTENLAIPYTFRTSQRARRMNLKMEQDGSLTITLPFGVSEHRGLTFAKQHTRWIERSHKKVNTKQKLLLKDGTMLPLFGKPTYKIVLDGDPQTIQDDGTTLFLHPEKKVEAVLSLYKTIAKEYIPRRVEFFAHHMKLTYKSIRIKNQKTRWGSCSSNKILNFNCRIMMAPTDVIDYVIVHELCHLVEMNHSKRFWRLVENVLPNYKKPYTWLKNNGHSLSLSTK